MDDSKALIKEWNNRVLVALNAHYDSARYYGRLHYILGVPAVVFSAIVGTTIFASMNKNTDTTIKFVAAGLGGLAAILTTLQTFLRYSEKAEKHRSIATQYSSVGKELEVLIATQEEVDRKTLDDLRLRLDKVDNDAPSIPGWIRNRSRKEYRSSQWDPAGDTKPPNVNS